MSKVRVAGFSVTSHTATAEVTHVILEKKNKAER